MSKIAIVTDSTSDLPKDLVKKNKLTSVPLSVIFKDATYLDDGKEITIGDFYKKLKSAEDLPTTSQPTPKDFVETYTSLSKKYDSILSIFLAQRYSILWAYCRNK